MRIFWSKSTSVRARPRGSSAGTRRVEDEIKERLRFAIADVREVQLLSREQSLICACNRPVSGRSTVRYIAVICDGCYEGWTRVICLCINPEQKADKAMVVPQTRGRPLFMSARFWQFLSRLGWQIT